MTIESHLDQMTDKALSSLIRHYLSELGNRFEESPASSTFHHNWKGGLRQHIEEVLDIGNDIICACSLDDVDIDHFTAAAILHDLGKVGTYYYDREQKRYMKYYGVRGDHSIAPLIWFLKNGYKLPETISLAVLGHMGGWSKTSIYPDTMLATVLASADMISSRLEAKR